MLKILAGGMKEEYGYDNMYKCPTVSNLASDMWRPTALDYPTGRHTLSSIYLLYQLLTMQLNYA
jgi:hypothetical protein